ncbi:hypothetical protein MRX96_037330 [Rhipicephalus microplus]
MNRGAERGSSVTSSESKCSVCQQYKRSAELSIRYGQYACRFCFRFYAAFLRKPKKFVCPKDATPSATSGDCRPRRPPRKRRLSEDKTRAENLSEMPKPVLSSPDDSQDTLTSSSDSIKSTHGPRIKHVCRRAAVVLGQKQATFPPAPAGRISLSALSEEDKSRLAVHHSSQEEDSSPEVPERNRRKDDSKKRDDSGGRKRDEGGPEEGPREESATEERELPPQEEQGQQERREGTATSNSENKVGQEEKQGAEEAAEVPRTPEAKKRKSETDKTGAGSSLVVGQLDQLVKQVKQEAVSDEIGPPAMQPSRTESPDIAEEKMHPPAAPMEDLAPDKSAKREVPVETSRSGRALRRKTDQNRGSITNLGYTRVRKARCNQCPGCLAEDCGKCACCRDKKKFGGKNLLKQACLHRRCSNLSLKPWNRSTLTEASEAELASEQSQRSPPQPCKIEEEAGNKPEAKSRKKRKPKMMLPPKPVKSKDPEESARQEQILTKPPWGAKCKPEVPCGVDAEESRGSKENGSSAGGVTTDQETGSQGSWENSSGSNSTGNSSTGGSNSVAAKEARLQAKMYAPLVPKVVDHPLSSRQLSKKSVGHGNQPLVQALLWDEYERSKLLSSGFPLVSAKQFAVQAVCFLCGSAGEEELLFCTVCCEPYHWFCLDTEEVPQPGMDRECWCCPRCQACIVCGHRSSQLLRCNKCQQMYHTDCLGPGYPSKPSRKKKIWVCMKCICCKSCGSTSSKNSSWNFDLSLCHECMLLREKGNYCPLCEKCYEDDDYESMMVQCSQCQKWIHARCDGISEELYQVLSLLPETELYLCRLCEPDSPRLWLGTAERVLQERLRCIMNSLTELQKASKDRCQVLEQAVPTPPDLMALPDETQDKDGSLDSTEPTATLARTELHFVDLIKVQHRLECGEYTTVKEFCEDVLQATTDSRVSVQMVRDLLGKLLEEAFPNMRPSPLPPTPPHEPSALLGTPGSLLLADAQPGLLRDTTEQGVDSRQCVLCGQPGDDSCNKSGRLLYAGQDNWVHVNCALWSAEVFEQGDGALHRVHSAISRGRYLRCEVCGIVGATVGCCVRGCPANFHFGCAQAAQAVFQADKKVFCSFHQGNVNREVVEGDKFSVCRAVYVDQQDVNSKWQKAWEATLAQEMTVIAGAMTIECLGYLTEASDLENVLVPVNYRCRRMFWSTQNPRQRVVYVCRTYEVRPPRPPPCEEDWGANVTTAHDDTPPGVNEFAQCDISSENCDNTGGGLTMPTSECLPASSSAPDLDDLDAKILDELARCVQNSDSQMDFAELLENISRSVDVAKCEAASASVVGGQDQQPFHQDSVHGAAEVPPASAVPLPEAHMTVQSNGQQLGGSGETSSSVLKFVAKPVKQQQQSVCGCTCENRTAKAAASRLAMTPTRVRSRPPASPKIILPKAQSPCLGIPPVAATQPLVSYSPYAYNFPMINQFPSTINMTSVSCDKFEVYEVPGGTIIIPRQHYRLENCVSTLSMAAAGAQVAYLGSLPLVAAPFMQPAAPPLAFIGGLGGQAAAPVMPLALQSPGVCGQVPLVTGGGLVANAGVMAPSVASAGLMTSVTSQTSVVNTGPTPGARSSSTAKRVPCYANAHRNMLAQKQSAKAAMMRKRMLQSGKQVTKAIVAQGQAFVARERCAKCLVLPVRTAAAASAGIAAPGDALKVTPAATAASQPAASVATPTSTTSAPPATVLPVAAQAQRSVPSPEVYPEPDSSTEFLSGPGACRQCFCHRRSHRSAPVLRRALEDGWPPDTDSDPCPPTSSNAMPPDGKEPVHSTVGILPPAVPQREEVRSPHFDRPYIVYEISSEDGFLHSSPNAHEVWRYLFEKLQDARAGANMQPLTNDDVDGFALMGLTHKAVVYLTEQLRGADNCENYIFKYHKRNSTKLPENPSGCARLEGFKSRGHHDMFKFLASAHRSPPCYDPSSDNGDEVEVLHKSCRDA